MTTLKKSTRKSTKATVARGRRKASTAGKVVKTGVTRPVKKAKTAARRRKQAKVAGAVAGAAALTAAGVMIIRARLKK